MALTIGGFFVGLAFVGALLKLPTYCAEALYFDFTMTKLNLGLLVPEIFKI